MTCPWIVAAIIVGSVLVFLGTGANPAAAQDGGGAPRMLLDEVFEQAIEASRSQNQLEAVPETLPKTGPKTGPETSPETTQAPIPSEGSGRDVRTSALETIDPASVGTLDPANGGFSPGMWRGSARAAIESLIPNLPAATASGAVQSLVRRLLLTRAAVPNGPPSDAGMLAVRVERLLAAGRAGDVVQLIGHMVGLADNIQIARTDALILSGDLAAACDLTKITVRESDDPYWLKAAVLCRAKAGDSAGAGLALELLHEQETDDPEYLTLAAKLLAPADGKPVAVATLDALRIEILRVLGSALPTDAVRAAGPKLLAALSRNTDLDLDLRLEVAERAVSLGAISGGDLERIYSAVAFPPDDVGNALDTAKSRPGPRSNALLYQLATGDGPEEERYQALQTLWRLGEKSGHLATVARASRKVAAAVVPDKDLSWLAPDMVRAMLAAGDLQTALRWYAVLPSESRARFWPLLAVADRGGAVAPPGQAANAWLRTLSDLVAGQRRTRARLAFTLIEQAGRRIPDKYWRDLTGPGTGDTDPPDPAALRLLDSASTVGRLGETVIRAVMALGVRGPAHAHPVTLARVFRALTAVGLPDDARRIAVEAMIGQGL